MSQTLVKSGQERRVGGLSKVYQRLTLYDSAMGHQNDHN